MGTLIVVLSWTMLTNLLAATTTLENASVVFNLLRRCVASVNLPSSYTIIFELCIRQEQDSEIRLDD